MTLSKEQKAAVAKILASAASSAKHRLVHSDNCDKREFYRALAFEAEDLLLLFAGREPVEIEVEEDEEEDDES